MSEAKKYFLFLLMLFLISNISYAAVGEKIEDIDFPANCGASDDITECGRCHNQNLDGGSFGIQSFGLSSDFSDTSCGGNPSYDGLTQTYTSSDGKITIIYPDTAVTIGTNICFENIVKINGYILGYTYYEDGNAIFGGMPFNQLNRVFRHKHFYSNEGLHNYTAYFVYCINGAPIWCGRYGLRRVWISWSVNIGEGELAVPYYSQSDTTSWNGYNSTGWANEIYDSTDTTIERLGCALTSTVMALRYYEADYGVDSAEVNPRNLNIWLNRNEGYEPGGLIRWVKAIDDYSSARVVFNGFANNFETMDIDLNNGCPVIVKVPKSFLNTHFVIVKGKTVDTTYKINDPYWKDRTSLQSYGNQFDTTGRGGLRRVKRKTVEEKGKLEVYIHSPIEVLLIDPQGRRVGYDPETKTMVAEMPEAWYGEEDAPYPILEEGEIPPPKKPPVKALYVQNMEEGNYTLQTYGVAEGSYRISMLLYYSHDRNLDSTFEGVTGMGTSSQYNIVCSPIEGESLGAERVVIIQTVRDDIENIFKLGWIDNEGIKNSLLNKLEAVEKAKDRDDKKTAENILNAFRNEVEAQKRKHINEKGAKILLDDVDYLISHIN